MIATARKLIALGSRNRSARVLVQALVSLALLGLLLHAAPQDSLAAAWEAVGWHTLLLACGFYMLASIISVRRWQILLRGQGVNENMLRLTEIYFIGLFCSLFLPTSAGGDAYRIFEVARRQGPTARVLLATLQDRLLGLGGMMLLGLIAVACYSALLPPNLLITVLVVYGLGILGVVALLNLGPLLRRSTNLMAGFEPTAGGGRLLAVLTPLRQAPPLNAWRTLRVVSLALATFVCAVFMYAVVGEALGASCSFLALCLIVSLVAVARMLPISLGGLGVGEEAFVMLTGLFGIASDKATPIALVILGVGVAMSLLGGLLLVRRMLFVPTAKQDVAEPTIVMFPAVVHERGGARAA
jgi:glycosyltransferase 2 family protein